MTAGARDWLAWLAGGTNKKCSIYVASCEIGAEEIRDGGREAKHRRSEMMRQERGDEGGKRTRGIRALTRIQERRSYLAILFLPHF